MSGQAVVYVVAKAPRAGASKTRLCPPLQPEQAAQLSEAFLLDSLLNVRQAGLAARIICRDAGEQAALQHAVGGLATVCAQRGRGLGNALESAFHQGLEAGYAAVGVLGSDSPTLPAAILAEAFTSLTRDQHVALGPSDDGGYYLLAARACHSRLFHDVPWSTSTVTQITLARCRSLSLDVHLLPVWYDVDDHQSLARLHRELWSVDLAIARHTRAALAAHDLLAAEQGTTWPARTLPLGAAL